MPSRRALLISENAPVPSDRRVWNEARSLAAAGWDVSIVCAQGQDRDNAPHEVVDGIAIHRFPLRPSGGGPLGYLREYGQAMWRIRRLARKLARISPFDVVHSANPPTFYSSPRVASSARARSSCSTITTSSRSSTNRVSVGAARFTGSRSHSRGSVTGSPMS